MEIGASSACFYPLETEKAFLHIAELGFKYSEIFFNCRSELKPAFVRDLKEIKDAYGMNVVSLHPYRSFAEGYNFFSSYERRYLDGIDDYKRYFNAAATLGAKYIVMHGAKNRIDISLEEYAERFGKLNEVARSFGCTVAHENVVHFVGAQPEFMLFMKKQLGDEFKMVLDIKQARRACVNPFDFIEIMGNNIVHVHLSDCDSEGHDCLPPDEKGEFGFRKLFTELHKVGYNGRYMIELYSNNFHDRNEIINSAKYLENILNEVREGK
ncbi:MAG: sugar phosphate isomerase/epimerase [Clostridia bacterium]|nr:sugar phosphate isomerase/epimerase [Clostridia bacterium]